MSSNESNDRRRAVLDAAKYIAAPNRVEQPFFSEEIYFTEEELSTNLDARARVDAFFALLSVGQKLLIDGEEREFVGLTRYTLEEEKETVDSTEKYPYRVMAKRQGTTYFIHVPETKFQLAKTEKIPDKTSLSDNIDCMKLAIKEGLHMLEYYYGINLSNNLTVKKAQEVITRKFTVASKGSAQIDIVHDLRIVQMLHRIAGDLGRAAVQVMDHENQDIFFRKLHPYIK